MYKARYTTRIDFEGKQSTKLEAEFRFRRDVAPDSRAKVRSRIDASYGGAPLRDYLEKVEGCRQVEERTFWDKVLQVDAVFIADTRERTNCRKVKVYGHSFGALSPGFNIAVSCSGKVSMEEMLDLGALNRYLLTGEIPERE